MAPSVTPRGRGRPRKVSLTSSATSSRISSTKPSARTSSRLSSKPASLEDTMDDETDGLLSLSDLHDSTSMKPQDDTKGRDPLLSVSPSLDFDESSGYSTPATSAVATPAESQAPPSGRGSRRVATMVSSTPAVNAVARAAALRNSKFSLSSAANKRKFHDSDEEEDEDNTPDAQLARSLQAQEDAAASEMNNSFSTSLTTRRSARKVQKIAPKKGFVSDSLDSDFEMPDAPFDSTVSKSKGKAKVKIELGAKGSNSVTFSSSKKTTYIQDSEDSEALSEIDDFDDDDDIFQYDSDELMATTSGRKAPTKKNIKKEASSDEEEEDTDDSDVPMASISRPVAGKASRRKAPVPRRSKKARGVVVVDSDDSVDLSDLDTSDDDDLPLAVRTSGTRVPIDMSGLVPDQYMNRRALRERRRLESHHPELKTMWQDLENLPKIGSVTMEQPKNINRELKPFQLEGVAWMRAMEKTEWGGGLLGDEMGMGKTIQAVSLIMSDWPQKKPSLVLIPPVALMQWQQEIASYTDGTLKTFVFHGTNRQTNNISVKELMKYDVLLMSYNSLESMYRKQEKGFKRKAGLHREESVIHKIHFHRVILDEAHNIKSRTTGSAKACFALKADHKWCLSGTPLQNRIGEFFSLVRFLDIKPFACYFCKQCTCSHLNWQMDEDNKCTKCHHTGMQHVSVFNQELLNPIQKWGNKGPGIEAFRKLRLLTGRFMLRRVKRDHSSAMELPAKEIHVDRQFFGEEENDFASSIMNNGTRKFETYVAQGVLLNNYANIFGLIMQMRQVADHPDLILKKNGEGGQNILVCCICDETAEEAIRSACKHEFCRDCAKHYLASSDTPDCPVCHIPLSIDLEQPDIEQDEQLVKKSSIINRINMKNWTSSSKIEALVADLHELRSKNMSHKSIIFSQFTTMLQLVEWRLRRAGITTVMLDGSMTPAQRQASINHFMKNVNVECFLVSLKAGGVALNLTEASHVFIVDPWWNPAAEWQSADRCHRIGQARPCSITRLCIEDSVESRMVLLQEKKANMINSTINSDDAAMESLTPEDMQFLFRGS